MNAEKAARVFRRERADLVCRPTKRARERLHDVREKRRLVAPRFRLRLHVARREVRRIGFDEQPLALDFAHELEEVPPAALVADPAGDADVEAEIEVSTKFLAAAGKAVRDCSLRLVMHQDLREARVRIARVQEKRLAKLKAEFHLRNEALLLD